MDQCIHGRSVAGCSLCQAPTGPQPSPCGHPGATEDGPIRQCQQCHDELLDILAAGPTRPGYQHSAATWVEGREAPSPSGFTPRARELDRAAAALPDIEACARAAYEARARREGNPDPWDHYVGEDQREMWREVARAVLAAAKGAGR